MADRKAIGTFLAWGIVLVVGLILVGSALVASNSGKKLTYNERSAIRCLQAVVAAQKIFRDADLDENGVADYWTADVAALAGFSSDVQGKRVPLISPGLAFADPRAQKPPKKLRAFCGYFFAALREPEDVEKTHPARFAVAAWPESYGDSGRETFFIDERGVVHGLDTQGKAPAAWPREAEPITRILDD